MNSKKLILAFCILISLPVFAQQADLTMIPYRLGNLWGYASPDKSIVIKPAFDEAKWFYAGFAAVRKGSLYGYINSSGKLVIPYKFYAARAFRYGYFDSNEKHTAGGKLVQNKDSLLFAGASLTKDGNERCIDTKGQVMSKCPAINENSVAETKMVENITQKEYGLVAANGNLYDKIIDDYKIDGDADNYYVAVKNNAMGIFNNKFEIILPFEYSLLKKLNTTRGSLLLAEKNGMKGVLNGNGKALIPVENSDLTFIKADNGNEYFIVTKNGAATVKDIQLADVIAGNFSTISFDKPSGFILTGNDKLAGYYFAGTGKLIGARYAEVKSVHGGAYIMVTDQAGKAGYIDSNGKEFFE